MATRNTPAAVSVPAAVVPAVSVPATVSWPETREEAIIQSRTVVMSMAREYGSTASRMCITPQGLMEAFGRELLSAYADEDGVPHEFDENEKTDLAIAKVGFKLASMCHQRLQNNGLKAGDTKEPLSVYYTWKDIQPNQVGVIQSLLIELDGVAKTRPTSMMRLGVRYWQGRYNDIFTATPNTQADHVDLLEELDFG